MKHLIKIISLISALCIMLCMFAGCSDSASTREIKDISKIKTQNDKVPTGVVAENEYFTMEWDAETALITYTSKADGTKWSTTSQDYVEVNPMGGNLYAPLTFQYTENNQDLDYQQNDIYAKCIKEYRFTPEKRANGITVSYYFDDKNIIIPVSYYLEDDGFKVSVDPKTIKCHGEATVVSVTPSPFACAAMNTDAGSKDSYLVVPSGSGALMYIDQRNFSSTLREITNTGENTMPLYGYDYAAEKFDETVKSTPVTMPFYGIKNGEKALCAIVEQSAEACNLVARAGDTGFEPYTQIDEETYEMIGTYGFSYIAANYKVLGTNKIYNGNKEVKMRQSDIPTNLNPLVIGYYPLTGDNSNYTGMAKRYQKYLVNKEKMTKSKDNSLLTVKLLGSYVEDDLFLGIPTTTDVALTSYAKAEEVLSKLNKISGGSLVADMYGYGDGGINGSQLAGGYSLTGVVGDDDELAHFIEYAKKNNIQTFFNFDTILLYESGNGYSVTGDTAVGVTGITTPIYKYWHSTGARMENKDGQYVGALLSRKMLAEATGDVVALADEFGISGLAFNTLGNICYSDYTEDDNDVAMYPNRKNMANDVKKIVNDTKAKNKTVMMDGAHSYAALSADYITGVPTASNQHLSLDVDVPLYQIVFQGYKSLSTDAINMANNRHTQYLKAIETGTGLAFTLIGADEYPQELRKQHMRGLNTALYSDNEEFITACVNESKTYLAKVAGATIKSHEYVTDDVVKTVFDNGITVIVNYGETAYTSDLGVVEPNSFITNA